MRKDCCCSYTGHRIDDQEGRIPLHYAAECGELSVVQMLLEREEQWRTVRIGKNKKYRGKYKHIYYQMFQIVPELWSST